MPIHHYDAGFDWLAIGGIAYIVCGCLVILFRMLGSAWKGH